MMTLAQRAAATAQVAARFRARPFDWATGGTCIHLARAQMRAMGHRPPPIPRFRSALGARRALAATGYADLAALLDSMLPSIAPALMWVGDIALMPSEDDLGAVVVSLGQSGPGIVGGGQIVGAITRPRLVPGSSISSRSNLKRLGGSNVYEQRLSVHTPDLNGKGDAECVV
ncbi:DUF6950 family protein [Sphingomonas panni]